MMPALTPEEWVAQEWKSEDDKGAFYQFAQVNEGGLSVGSYNDLYAVGDVSGPITGRGRIAVGALALIGYFTLEHVRMCRALAAQFDAEHDASVELADYENAQAWEALANLIAALLPPEARR